MLRSLEYGMLGKVCQAVLLLQLIARAGVDYQRTMGYVGFYAAVYAFYAVRESVCFKFLPSVLVA